MFGVKGALAFIFLLLFLPPSSHGASRNRCRACKEFVESFEKGLRATENSNFAGGDVSWEEEKLGSYANSEVRLVEILDTVCSRSNHECHNLVENHEEHIERWWFKLRHSGKKDLKTWFCFNHLDVCCPENTYGPTCKECPGGVGNVCGGRGKCEGAEEMDGSGTCSCEKGYEGDTCESCASGFYNDSNSCLACDKACLDDCTGPGPESCEECGSGYVEEGDGEEVVCRDKDECTEDDSLCKEGTYCFNTPGSYKCNACDKSCKKGCTGPGPAKCVECKAGYDRTDLGVCKDKDECEEPPCSDGTFCENTPGSYVCKACHVSCVLACTGPGAGNCFECKGGYSRENGTCTDINECEQGTLPCDKDTETCHNLVGTHVCKCKRGLVRTDGKCVEEVEVEDRPTEPPTPKPKKKKKKKKTGAKSVPKRTKQSEPAEANTQPKPHDNTDTSHDVPDASHDVPNASHDVPDASHGQSHDQSHDEL